MQDEVQQQLERAAQLRNEGRLDEARLSARRATQIAPDDANAWWELARIVRDQSGPASAIECFRKVVELAPGFATGWAQLGWAFKAAERAEEAIEAFEQGHEADEDNIPCLRLLALSLKDQEDEDNDDRRLQLLQRLALLDSLDEDEKFDLAYLLGKMRDHLQAAHVYEGYTKEHGGDAAFFNLSISYSNIGRDLDALDALAASEAQSTRLAEKQEARRKIVEKALSDARERMRESSNKRLPIVDWYKTYINPFELLNVQDASEVESPRDFQKARQTVLREIDLESGKIEWMPGLEIDRSKAIEILEAITNDEVRKAHQQVFENRALCDFLMRGNLLHFIAAKDSSAQTLPYLLPQKTLDIIGPLFAVQYDAVLTRALTAGDYAAVECLFDGRKWLRPEDQERSLEGAKRAVQRLCEPLEKLASAAEGKSVPIEEIKRALSRGEFEAVLQHLPVEFHETHSKVAGLLRSLSVSHYNTNGDAEQAKAIVLLGSNSASRSPALKHRLQEDLKHLDSLIAEESKHQVHLTWRQEPLVISKNGIQHGDKRLAPSDVDGLRWGLVRQPNGGIKHVVSFTGTPSKPIIDVIWTSNNDLEAQKRFWTQMVDAAIAYILPSVFESVLKRLRNGETLRLGPAQVSRAGVQLSVKGWFTDRMDTYHWSDLAAELENGEVVVRSKSTPKANAKLDIAETNNAFVLYLMCNREDLAL